jgi:hypothetical protein
MENAANSKLLVHNSGGEIMPRVQLIFSFWELIFVRFNHGHGHTKWRICRIKKRKSTLFHGLLDI